MTAADIPRVAEIGIFGWRAAYRGIVSDEIMFRDRLVVTQIARMEARFRRSENPGDYFVDRYVYDDGIVKGNLVIAPCGDEDKPEAFELCVLYVDPAFKGEGIGTLLARYCEDIARARGYREICLWTFEKNAPTRAFYEKLGYIVDGCTQVVEPYGAVGVRYCKQL